METIPQKELRNDVSRVLRRVESGESLIVTVAGRPVAELHPTRRHTWVSNTALARIWRTDAPRGMESDLERLDAALTDPFDT